MCGLFGYGLTTVSFITVLTWCTVCLINFFFSDSFFPKIILSVFLSLQTDKSKSSSLKGHPPTRSFSATVSAHNILISFPFSVAEPPLLKKDLNLWLCLEFFFFGGVISGLTLPVSDSYCSYRYMVACYGADEAWTRCWTLMTRNKQAHFHTRRSQ